MRSSPGNSIVQASLFSAQEVLLESISDPIYSLRTEPSHEEIRELAASMKALGLLHPIIVVRLSDSSGFRLIAGYRRLQAAKQLGWRTIPACVIKANESDQIMLSLAENLDRRDVDPLRVAEALHSLRVRSGVNLDELAKNFGKSPQWVSNLLRLNRYNSLFREAVEVGDLHLQHCLEICVLGKVDSMAQAIRFARKIKLSVRDLREYIRLLKRIDEIKEALRCCNSQEERQQLTIELQELNVRLGTLEGMEKTAPVASRSRDAPCDSCGRSALRRHMHSVRLCPSCYLSLARRLTRRECHDRKK